MYKILPQKKNRVKIIVFSAPTIAERIFIIPFTLNMAYLGSGHGKIRLAKVDKM